MALPINFGHPCERVTASVPVRIQTQKFPYWAFHGSPRVIKSKPKPNRTHPEIFFLSQSVRSEVPRWLGHEHHPAFSSVLSSFLFPFLIPSSSFYFPFSIIWFPLFLHLSNLPKPSSSSFFHFFLQPLTFIIIFFILFSLFSYFLTIFFHLVIVESVLGYLFLQWRKDHHRDWIVGRLEVGVNWNHVVFTYLEFRFEVITCYFFYFP